MRKTRGGSRRSDPSCGRRRQPVRRREKPGLGRLLQRLGDYTGAEVALRRALEIRETLGPEHLLVAKSLYNLGRLLQDRGEQGAASDLLKRSFNIRLARF